MSTDDKSRDTGSARRRFLKLSGVAGAAALAGCSSGTPSKSTGTTTSGGGTTTTSSGNGGGSSDKSLTVPATYVPANMQWNSYAPSHYSNPGRAMIFDPFLFYNMKTDSLIPSLFQSWKKNGTTLTVTLRDQTWHDGTPVTAADVVTKFKINKGFGYQVANYVSDAKAVDDHTVQYTLAKNYRTEPIMLVLSGSWMDTPKSKYGKFAKRFDSASSDKERQQVQSDVQNYQPKKPLGCGPFQFKSANQQVLTETKYDKHPVADQIKFPTYEVVYESSNQQQWAAMKNGEQLDATTTTFFPDRIVKSLPSYVQQYQIPAYNGYALGFNHSDEDFGNRNVRRAVANVIDQNKMAKLADSTKTAVTAPVGVGSYKTGTWKRNLGGDVSAYDTYTDQSKAESLLKGEGYTKKGGKWYKPNGKQFKITLPCPAGWSDFVSFGTTVAQMLTNFGIKTQSKNVESTTFFGQYFGPTNFKVIPWFWNNGQVRPKPFFSLSWILTSGTIMSNFKYDKQPEAPPMGKPDGQASKQDVRSMLRTLGTTSDQQKQTSLARNLAWIVNQNLPVLPLIEKVSQSFWNTKRWNVPPKDTEKQYVHYEYFYWPRIGLVSPK